MNLLFFPYEIYANLVGFHTLVPVIHVYTCSDTKQKRHIHANLVKICQLVQRYADKHFFCLKFSSLSAGVTLKIRSWSPKPIQLFIMSQCYSIYMQIGLKSANKILFIQATFGINLAS